jgi:epoxide hydrolase-like predicted phosphatase
MIKAVIFDCFDVLYPDPVFAFIRDPDTPHDKGEALHNLDKQAAVGQLTKEQFIEQASAITEQTPAETEERFFKGTDLNKRLVDFILQIRSKYRIALLSNIGADMMDGFFTPADYKSLFDEVILSGAIGVAKPNPKIFKLACSKLGVNLDEALMVDDMASTIEAVNNMGMHGICYKDYQQFLNEFYKLVKN